MEIKNNCIDADYIENNEEGYERGKRFLTEINIVYWILNILLRAFFFVLTFITFGVLWICLDNFIYGYRLDSNFDTIIGAISSIIISTILFNKFMVEIKEIEEGEDL